MCPCNNSLSPTLSPYLSSLIHRRPVRQCYFLFTYTFLAFFVVFHQKIYLFIYLFIHSFIYSFIYLWNINFPQENIDELETGIGDRKLSVELCGGLILFLVFCIIFVDEICQHLGKSLFTAILQILWQKPQLGVALVLSSNLLHLFYLSHHMWSFLKWFRK